MSNPRQSFRRLLQFTVVLALCVIILGAYTRLSDAGLGCPDWPGCYGHLVGVPDELPHDEFDRPLETDKAWKEMIHRYLAGILGLAVLAIFIFAVAKRKQLQQSVLLPTLLLCTVIFQALLGMWTVTLLLSPVIVTAHLIGGFTTLSLTWLLLLNQSRDTNAPSPDTSMGLRFWAAIGFLLLVGQIFLGGWTSTHYAALACGTDFPTCMSQWWPTMDFDSAFQFVHHTGVDYEFGTLESPARTAVQVTHRIGALIVGTYLIGLFLLLLVQPQRKFAGLAGILLLVLATQITLGILNVVMALPLSIAVAHNLVAALLLLTVITINHRSWFRVAAPDKR